MVGREFLGFALFGALACAGCTSDEATICQRLEECRLLPEGFTETECEANVGSHVSDDRLDRCAECVTGEPCDQLQATCKEHCEPIY